MLDPKEIRRLIAEGRRLRLGVPFVHAATVALRRSVPEPEALRRLATYVDIDELRKIDDPDLIAARFQELGLALQKIAAAFEEFDSVVGKSGVQPS